MRSKSHVSIPGERPQFFGMRASPQPKCFDFDLQPRITQNDLVAGPQSCTAFGWRHDNRQATSLNACFVGPSIVTQTISRRTAGGFDVSMSSRHARIRLFGAFSYAGAEPIPTRGTSPRHGL